MRFLIIGHAKHKEQGEKYFAYAPYVREMNIWLKHVDEVEIVVPTVDEEITAIDIAYQHSNIEFNKIPTIEFTSIGKGIMSLLKLPFIVYKIYGACRRADHIHLRCPGNIGLLGCLVQIFFPRKKKTSKYAGNWDPKAIQPSSYKFQKRILESTSFTKNMNVLVYGDWQNQSKNIKPFFTASFNEKDKQNLVIRDYYGKLDFMFVGSLVEGKRPLLTIKIVEGLVEKGFSCSLNIFGDGVLMLSLKEYVAQKGLESVVYFHGNVKLDKLKEEFRKAHFIVLPSKSEGWPKAIAEAMFFGVIPIATKVSCVPQMFDQGKRGVLIEPEANLAVKTISEFIETDKLKKMSTMAAEWSQHFTLDYFESEVKQLLHE